ncbi:hypothetical protein [Silvibacterium sp.]|uniref:tetratricopeptide repeat protein n=1 Tax=Silvibacterium sp. TaxID=1964179 RepID=UPI0039E290F9
MDNNTISPADIRAELERILGSPLFLQSERLGRFLRFTVEETLKGEHESLKEAVIGTQVYERRASYNPTQDSIVRTEARRLRGKLKEYYQGEGRENPVYIYFRPGSYIPVFRHSSTLDSGAPIMRNDGRVSLAVLPFLPLSEGRLANDCALGISDELVHALMRADGCRVIAASSISQLTAQAADIPSLAKRLGVHFVFDGTVQHAEGRLRIHARLVNGEGLRIWSQRFDVLTENGSLPDIHLFDIQERVVSALMTRIAPRLSPARIDEGLPTPVQVAVYPELLAAEELLEEGSLADLPKAVQSFRRLAEISPDNARAHCGVAQSLIWLSQRGVPDSQNMVAEAQSSALRALELDREMGDAHSALACAQALQWRWQEAEATFGDALELRANHSALRQYAAFLTCRGRFEQAWPNYVQSEKLDSFSHRYKAAVAYFFFMARRYDAGLHHFEQAGRYGTMPAEVYAYQALSLVQLGRYGEAVSLADSMQERYARHTLMTATVAEVYAAAGRLDAAKRVMAESSAGGRTPRLSYLREAVLAVAMGDRDGALEKLEAGFAAKEAELPWISVDPRFDVLREEPRFQQMVKQIG